MEWVEYDRMNATEDHMWWYRAAHQRLLDAWQGHPGPSGAPLLDAGCGTGGLLRRLSLALRARTGPVPSGPRLVGLDVHPPALAMAGRKSDAALVLGSANALPFRDASLGVIFSVDVLCHRQVDPAGALAEARRCLADGGRLIVNLPAYPWMLSFHDERVHNARRFSRSDVRQLLADAGFRDVSVRYWNCLLFPLMVVRRKLLRSPESASDVTEFGGLTDRIFGGLLALERAGGRLGLHYPFGGSLLAVATR